MSWHGGESKPGSPWKSPARLQEGEKITGLILGYSLATRTEAFQPDKLLIAQRTLPTAAKLADVGPWMSSILGRGSGVS